ncbi:MAG: metal ABC transporter substrate-binding protein [Acutalibacteraceae bacterium]|nr:metal ABC transporter substrate-binding protein [Oscillospiraceae bacterium]
MKKTAFILSVLLILMCLTGCEGTNSVPESTDRIQVVAAMFAEYDFARQISGGLADVKMLLPPGADMHDYEPTPKNIIDIKNADVFIYGGGESDAWLDTILESVDGKIKTVRMTDACRLLEEDEGENSDEEHEHSEYDEHVWTSPKNAVRIVGAITDALCSADEKNADNYRKNESEYISELESLDSDFRAAVSNSERDVVVFGDRFPLLYFVREYGLEYFAAFPGCSHDTEASAGTVRFLIDKVRKENIPVVFKIELSSDATAEAIAAETGARVLEFNSCHSITRDQFDGGSTYVSLMRQNLENLKIALN